jgi:hypothetical protein
MYSPAKVSLSFSVNSFSMIIIPRVRKVGANV